MALDLVGHGRSSPWVSRWAAASLCWSTVPALGLFARLVLSEAGAFPAAGGGPKPMSERTRTRRAVSPGRDMFVRIVGNKPPLSELAPDALDSYAHWGCWTGPR